MVKLGLRPLSKPADLASHQNLAVSMPNRHLKINNNKISILVLESSHKKAESNFLSYKQKTIFDPVNFFLLDFSFFQCKLA